MSGVFNPNEPGIESTDREDVAKAHGLTEYDDETGLYTAPKQDERRDSDLRPGEDAAHAGQDGEPVGGGVQPLGDATRPTAEGGVTPNERDASELERGREASDSQTDREYEANAEANREADEQAAAAADGEQLEDEDDERDDENAYPAL